MDVSFYFVVSFITIFINCIYTLENIPELHKCNEFSFCKRNMELHSKPHYKWMISSETIKVSETNMTVNLQNTKDQNFKLMLNIDFLREGLIKIQLKDPKESKERKSTYEYLIQKNILNSSQKAKGYITFKNATQCIIQFSVFAYQTPKYLKGFDQAQGLPQHYFRIMMIYRPFKLNIYFDQQKLIIINDRNLLNYETYREKNKNNLEKTKRDATQFEHNEESLWSGDSVLNGPLSVGLDFTFTSKQKVEYILYSRYLDSQFVGGIPQSGGNTLLLKDNIYRLYNNGGSIPYLLSISTQSYFSSILWLNPSHTYVKLQIDPNQIDRNAHFFSETGCLEFMVLASRDPFDHQHKLHYITGFANMPPLFALGLHYLPLAKTNLSEIETIFDEKDMPLDIVWEDEHFTEILVPSDDNQNKNRKILYKSNGLLKENNSENINETAYLRYNNGSKYMLENSYGRYNYMDLTTERGRETYHKIFENKSIHPYLSITSLVAYQNSEETRTNNPLAPPGDLILGELGEVQFGDIRSLYPKLIGNTIQQIYNETTHHNRKILLFESFYIGSHLHGGLWVEGRQPHSPIGMFLSFSISGQSLLGYNLSIDHPTSYSFIKESVLNPLLLINFKLSTLSSSSGNMERMGELRYKLLPYIYTQLYIYTSSGFPILRPLLFQYGMRKLLTKGNLWRQFVDREVFLGADLLISGGMEKENKVEIYLPTLDVWYNWWDYKLVSIGGVRHILCTKEEPFPIYIRGGGIIPMKIRRRRNSLLMSSDPYTLLVAPAKDSFAQGILYIDDYTTTAYQYGCYKLITYQYAKINTAKYIIKGFITHTQPLDKCQIIPDYPIENIIILGINNKPLSVLNSIGNKIHFTYFNTEKYIEIKRPYLNTKKNWEIKIIY